MAKSSTSARPNAGTVTAGAKNALAGSRTGANTRDSAMEGVRLLLWGFRPGREARPDPRARHSLLEWAFARLMFPPGPLNGYAGRDLDWYTGILRLCLAGHPPAPTPYLGQAPAARRPGPSPMAACHNGDGTCAPRG